MEAYALAALAGVGLYAARHQFVGSAGSAGSAGGAKPVAVANVAPSVNTVYDSTRVADVAHFEQERADAMAQRVRAADLRVVDRSARRVVEAEAEVPETVRSALAGVDIPREQFTHNNMTPFFRGDVKQSLNPWANNTLMETFTGGGGFFRPANKSKREVENFTQSFQQVRDLGNMHGTPLATGTFRDRIAVPQARRNEFPIPSTRVGPGINQGFTAAPSDGYLDQRAFNLPRTTDELRPADKPKLTFEGRVLPAQGAQRMNPTAQGATVKNRPDTAWERGPETLLPTTGAFLMETQRAEPMDRPQARQDTTREYAGAAFAASSQGATQRPLAQAARTQALAAPQPGPVAAPGKGDGERDDKGRASIQVYANERDVTTTRVYQGNLTAFVKSLTAPLLDALRPNRAACPHIVLAPREEGNFKGPQRLRVYDPEDVMRTTLREGLSELEPANLAVPVPRGVAHDPDDTARTTMRQTLLHEAEAANLRGPVRGIAHDPEDAPRTTTKQTLLQEAQALNVRGPTRTVAYDPEDVLRTTMRETLTSEGGGAVNLSRPVPKGGVYERDEAPRVTHRETLEDEEDRGGYVKAHPKAQVWDPEDVLRTTTKETLVDVPRDAANPDALTRQRGGYESATYNAPLTHKQFTSDADYFGHGARDIGGGHETAPTDLRPAAKAALSDNDYYGGAADQGAKAPPSHEAHANAEINELRELLLEGRAPTASGVKVPATADGAGSMTSRRQVVQVAYPAAPSAMHAPPDDGGEDVDDVLRALGRLTHERQQYVDAGAGRFQDALDANQSQRHGNPLSISLAP